MLFAGLVSALGATVVGRGASAGGAGNFGFRIALVDGFLVVAADAASHLAQHVGLSRREFVTGVLIESGLSSAVFGLSNDKSPTSMERDSLLTLVKAEVTYFVEHGYNSLPLYGVLSELRLKLKIWWDCRCSAPVSRRLERNLNGFRTDQSRHHADRIYCAAMYQN